MEIAKQQSKGVGGQKLGSLMGGRGGSLDDDEVVVVEEGIPNGRGEDEPGIAGGTRAQWCADERGCQGRERRGGRRTTDARKGAQRRISALIDCWRSGL